MPIFCAKKDTCPDYNYYDCQADSKPLNCLKKPAEAPEDRAPSGQTDFVGCKPEGNNLPIEYVDWLFGELAKINEMEFEDIVWTENGKPINIHPKDLKDFKFTGLSNSYFARLKFWGKGL